MCACPPQFWLLAVIAALLVALGITGLLNAILSWIITGALALAVAAVVIRLAVWATTTWWEHRSDRLWNAKMHARHQQPQLATNAPQGPAQPDLAPVVDIHAARRHRAAA